MKQASGNARNSKKGAPAGDGARIRWNMLLRPEEADFIKEQARREGRTAADLVRSAIERVYRPFDRLDPILALNDLKGDYLPRERAADFLFSKTESERMESEPFEAG